MRAEAALGPRDASKKLYQPQFSDGVPHIFNTNNPDGVIVRLSRNGECYWPTVVYEMAHETVHLLNPVSGDTNNLEEGVAVAFSLIVQPNYGISIQTSMRSYLFALQLIATLPNGPPEAGRLVRECVGALSAPTVHDLEDLFPSVDRTILGKLVEEFERDVE